MRVFRRNGFWKVGGYVDGEEYQRSTGIRHKKPAHVSENAGRDVLLACARIEAEFAADLAKSREGVVAIRYLEGSLATIEKLFFQNLKNRRVRPATEGFYRSYWSILYKAIPSLEAVQSRVQLETVVAQWYAQGFSTNSVKKAVRVLICAWKIAVDEGVKVPPVPPMPKNFQRQTDKDEGTSGKFREQGLVQEFLSRLPNQESRDRATLVLLTGLRSEETRRLHLMGIERTDEFLSMGVVGFLWVPKEATKSNKNRWIGLTAEAAEIIERNRPFKSRDNKKAFEGLSRKMGLAHPITLRDLRATFATGVNMRADVKEAHINHVMGHDKGVPSRYQKPTALALAKVAQAAHVALHGEQPTRAQHEHSPRVMPLSLFRK